MAADSGYDLTAYHIPKTIDNDLVVNDHTPGFGSAAKFVAQAFMGDNMDNAALPGIKINIIMGRHAGFLTAAAGLGRRQNKTDGPHLIYVPEVAFDENKFIDDVERVYKKHGRCLIAVSEGIHDQDGTAIMTKLMDEVEKDDHGNVQLSGSGALGLRVRADTFGYLQRSFAGVASTVDQIEARECGRQAVIHAMAGEHKSGSIAMVRTSNHPYVIDYRRIAISDVAAKTQHLDTKYILDGCDISDAFYADYLTPIVGELPVVESF